MPARNRYTTRQLVALARQAGFRGRDIPVAAAVAQAESAGWADARGDISLQTGTWGPSIGLWQIRSLNEQKGTGGVRDEIANRDPLHNARSARSIAATSRGWKHWSTVLHGSYLRFLPAAEVAAAA